jgi:hypothetical protein
MSKRPPDAEQRLLTVLREICAQLPLAEEYLMVHHPAFRVGKKPFRRVANAKQRAALDALIKAKTAPR